MTPAAQWVLDYVTNHGGNVLYRDMYNESPYEHRSLLYPTIEVLRSEGQLHWWNGRNPDNGAIENRVKLGKAQ